MSGKIPRLPANKSNLRFAGRLQAFEAKRWGNVVQSWPRKRGKGGTTAQLEARAQFKKACAAIKYSVPEDVIAAMEFSQNTGSLPRDILMAAFFGTLITGYLQDGRVLYGARTLADEIQPMLDTITTELGAMLVRTIDGWVGLSPGDPDDVLTAAGPGVPPAWESPSFAGINGTAQASPDAVGTQSGPWTCSGMRITPLWNFALRAMAIGAGFVSGKTYGFGVYEISTGTIVSIVYDAPALPSGATGNRWQGYQFSPAINLAAGTEYALIWRVTSDGNSAPMDIDYDSKNDSGLPIAADGLIAYGAQANPIVGDVLTITGGGQYAMKLYVSW